MLIVDKEDVRDTTLLEHEKGWTMNKAIDITRIYFHPKHRIGKSLRYVNDKFNTFTVCEYFGPGEQDHPNVHRHATIEAARKTWDRINTRIEADGYVMVATQKKSA
jgi:hypothetical protein